MRYDEIRYLPEDEDPSLTIETERLVAKVIDNTGLLLEPSDNTASYMGRYGTNSPLPISHHLGYHGIRTLYDKEEGRNLVVPLASWLNLQGVELAGIENDPVDERAWAGVARGWPMRLGRRGEGAFLTIEPMPKTQFKYTIEFQPGGPDGIDFSIRFVFGMASSRGRFTATWPCYVNAYDDVRLFYPRREPDGSLLWIGLGEKPEIVIGEPVRYVHQQSLFEAENQAIPLAFGRIGSRALIMMLDDPRVRFFVINAGGHLPTSTVQNPAWDLSWTIRDPPPREPVGFNGRLVYTEIKGEDEVKRVYDEWTSSH